MSLAKSLQRKAIDIGKLSVESTTSAGSGHPSTAISLAHIIAVLMYHQMKWDPKDPWNPTADRLVLSEGHAVPILYAAYSDLGGYIGKNKAEARPMTRADLLSLRAIESPIDGHPHPQVGFPFADAATGSLGQGLSVAAGIGAAAKMDKSPRNVYCVIGDGESREGQIWEAADFIVDHELTNVVPIFNCNSIAQSDWVSPQQSSESLHKKLEAFGFITRTVNGHDPEALLKVFRELAVVQNGPRPLAIVAETVKGWGSPAEQGLGKHGHPVKKEQLSQILGELDATAADLGVASVTVADLKPAAPKPSTFTAAASPIKLPSYEEALEKFGFLKDVQAGKGFAPRRAYGVAIVMAGQADKRVVALDADVKNSTFAEWFFQRLPGQFLECRIAEQNMVSAAAGAAAAGKIPFCSTFAKFVVRAYDQFEMAVISGANIKVTGSHAGVTLAADGPSQMSLPDAAFFRSFAHVKNFNGGPAVRYFFPADGISTYRITELMANVEGACYLRTLRHETKQIYKSSDTFEVGGHKVLREGKDGVFVTAGYLVHESLRAAEELAKAGKSWGVVDAYSMPLNAKPIIDLALKSGGKIVTVEDNYAGGLESEIAAAIATTGAAVRLKSLYVAQIPKSGREPQEVLDYLGLGYKAICAAV